MSTTTPLAHNLQNGESPSTTVAQALDMPDITSSTEAGGGEPAKNSTVQTVAGVKLDVVNDSNQLRIKNQVQPTVQLCTEDNKKIIISGAKSVQDIPVNVLQQILNNVKNVKPNETVLVINHNKNSIQSTEVKSYESIVKDALGIDSPNAPPINVTKIGDDCNEKPTTSDPDIGDQTTAEIDSVVSNNLKIRNDDTKIKICNVDAIINKRKEEKADQEKLLNATLPATSQRVQPSRADPKQKKFLYRLKSKNGRILSYVSETPIQLKKPVIRLKKMTQADAERLSKQFAEESKRKARKSSKLSNSTAAEKTETDENSSSQQSYGVQTRKRRLKFLPDGRMVKDKKLKRGSSSSSLSSLDDDEDSSKPAVTSDEDYVENLDTAASSDEDVKIISYKPGTKKVTPPKNASVVSSKVDIKNNSNVIFNKGNYPRHLTPSVTIHPSTPPVAKKSSIEPASVFSSLLKIPILPSQLNVNRFKPKILTPSNTKTTSSFMFKKIFTPDIGNRFSVNPVSKSFNTSLSNSCTTPNGWTPRNLQTKVDYRTPSSVNPPPLAPLSQKQTPGSRNYNHSLVKKAIGNSIQDIVSKFEGFTNTRVVKTKDGPKKAMLEEKKKSEEPRTIYEIMEEIFDSMPHWNIHVIPENKSFCLAQISLGRTGIPILKKSIEINSEFMAKVYVHQLHCKRYDGIYDTERKIRKLISDVESLAS